MLTETKVMSMASLLVKSKLVCKLPRHFKCSNQPMVASVYAAKAVDNELHGMLG
jgi:hypothetical protein